MDINIMAESASTSWIIIIKQRIPCSMQRHLRDAHISPSESGHIGTVREAGWGKQHPCLKVHSGETWWQ